MAAKVLEIVNTPDTKAGDDDDDDVTLLHTTPFPAKKGGGATKSDAISVEDYRFKSTTKTKRVIDLTRDDHDHDHDDHFDDLKILSSFPKFRKRVFRGECSNSKPSTQIDLNAPPNFTCEICTDEKHKNQIFNVLGCHHSYCSDCMSKYVASKLEDNITTITCPVSACTGSLEPHHCRSILPRQVFDRWGDALCEAVILASQKFYCPFKDCSALLIDERSGGGGSEVTIVQSECPECNRLFCVECKVPWHSGLSCVEFGKLNEDERSNEDIMLMNLAKRSKWMRCPQCKFYVEKSDGCLFMQCRCGYTFCYNCGAQMTKHLHYCVKCKH